MKTTTKIIAGLVFLGVMTAYTAWLSWFFANRTSEAEVKAAEAGTTLQSRAVTNRVVTASWFGDSTLTERRFQEELLDDVTNTAAVLPSYSVYSEPWAWAIHITAHGNKTGDTGYWRDVICKYAQAGTYSSYSVEAVPDAGYIEGSEKIPHVDFSVVDSVGAVASFTNNVITPSNVPGIVRVVGVDTNGVSKESVVVMTPYKEAVVGVKYYREDPRSERSRWNSYLSAKLDAVSTAEADMVTYYNCRNKDNQYKTGGSQTWKAPRALSRFGTGGRIYTNEWTWAGSNWRSRITPLVHNRDFFWPELQTNLWCISVGVHEAANANGWNQYYIPYLAVAPHYVVFAGHYGDYMWSGTGWRPRFCRSTNDNDYVYCSTLSVVGDVPYDGSGSKSDVRLLRTAQEIPPQCIAKLPSKALLQQLSMSEFGCSPCLIVNCHQTVSPFPINSLSSAYYSWDGLPGNGDFHNHYPMTAAGEDYPAKLRELEHMTHMYDSGTIRFLVSPKGQVVPIGQTYSVSDGGGSSGPSYADVIESLSTMIVADSNGTEDISRWTFEELWTGGTNTFETAGN
ncbi:MAG: hypothetical protein J6T14_05880 [Clostridia bacterium]|nr:hypothetical protein [Clostridia bacterium]